MIRNSPAKVAEPGTASAIIPARSARREQGAPAGHAAERVELAVLQRRSTIPTRRNMLAETRACATDWQHRAVDPEVVNAKTPR